MGDGTYLPGSGQRDAVQCQLDQNKHRWLFARGRGRRGGEREPVCSAETSKQSKPQMPLLINTPCEADVYPGQSRDKKPVKA